MNVDQSLNYENIDEVVKEHVRAQPSIICDESIEKINGNQLIEKNILKESKNEDGQIVETLEDGQIEEVNGKNTYDGSSKGICKYHLNGICHWGISCRFIHDGINNLGAYKLFSYSNDLAKCQNLSDSSISTSNSNHLKQDIVLSNPMDPYSIDVGIQQNKLSSPWEKGLILTRNLQIDKSLLAFESKEDKANKSRFQIKATYHTPKVQSTNDRRSLSYNPNSYSNESYKKSLFDNSEKKSMISNSREIRSKFNSLSENNYNSHHQSFDSNSCNDRHNSRSNKNFRNKNSDDNPRSDYKNNKHSPKSYKNERNLENIEKSSLESRKNFIIKEINEIEEVIKNKKYKN